MVARPDHLLELHSVRLQCIPCGLALNYLRKRDHEVFGYFGLRFLSLNQVLLIPLLRLVKLNLSAMQAVQLVTSKLPIK
jgi:hypothetical protein